MPMLFCVNQKLEALDNKVWSVINALRTVETQLHYTINIDTMYYIST